MHNVLHLSIKVSHLGEEKYLFSSPISFYSQHVERCRGSADGIHLELLHFCLLPRDDIALGCP